MIRMAKATDVKALADLSTQLGYPCSEEEITLRFQDFQNAQRNILVAETDGVVVGYLAMERYHTLFMEPGLNITGLVVDQKKRSQGLGRSLVAAAEEYARAQNLKFLRANSGAQRTEAHEFYGKMGFHDQRDQKRFVKNLSLGEGSPA